MASNIRSSVDMDSLLPDLTENPIKTAGRSPYVPQKLGNRVKPAGTKWVAPQDPSDRHPRAPEDAVALNSLVCVFGARWTEATCWCKEG